jgi:hypothetical protein
MWDTSPVRRSKVTVVSGETRLSRSGSSTIPTAVVVADPADDGEAAGAAGQTQHEMAARAERTSENKLGPFFPVLSLPAANTEYAIARKPMGLARLLIEVPALSCDGTLTVHWKTAREHAFTPRRPKGPDAETERNQRHDLAAGLTVVLSVV